MKRIIRFTKARFIAISISLALIIFGITNFIISGGFNLGIDFKGGYILQVQIAPVGLTVTNTGQSDVKLEITKGGVLEANKKYLNITDEDAKVHTFELDTINSLNNLRDMLKKEVPDIGISLNADGGVAPIRLISIQETVINPGKAHVVNYVLQKGDTLITSLVKMRSLLSAIPGVTLQNVGEPEQQEFMIRANIPQGNKDDTQVSKKIHSLLADAYGSNDIIEKQSETMSPQLAQVLAINSIYFILIALALIMVYISIRFKITYAVGAIIALIHDVLIMLGFICFFHIEISTATIAAVLTIVGYSLNDTIVVYDRIRENFSLLREYRMDDIIDTSITQSLSRTIMTSLTTLIAVIPLYVLVTGSSDIKDFALSLLVGIVVGTYSSIYIASPVVLGWQKAIAKGKEKHDREMFGKRIPVTAPVIDTPDSQNPEHSQIQEQHKQVVRVQRTVKKKKKKKKKHS
ncbi:MAG: protein translocase subunit SecF [Spirochaetia bacterium]